MSTDSSSGAALSPLTLTTTDSGTTPPRATTAAVSTVVSVHRMDLGDEVEDRERSPPPRRGNSHDAALRTGCASASPMSRRDIVTARRSASSGSLPAARRSAEATGSTSPDTALPPQKGYGRGRPSLPRPVVCCGIPPTHTSSFVSGTPSVHDDYVGLVLVEASGALSASTTATPDFRAVGLAQEVRVHEVVTQESFVQSSQHLPNSEFEVRMRLDTHTTWGPLLILSQGAPPW